MVFAALIFRWADVLPAILRSVTSHPLVLVLLLVVGFQAHAEEGSTPQFGVRNVSIDQLADTAGEARELGTRAAAETAFAVVLERLLNDPEKISQFLDRHDLDKFSDNGATNKSASGTSSPLFTSRIFLKLLKSPVLKPRQLAAL